MINFGNCEDLVTNKQIVLKENQSKIIFKNNKQNKVRLIRIDGCVITSGRRCDYLIISEKSIEHYIELKGSDIDRAIEQLENTIKKVSSDHKNLKKYCFIISSRCPLLTAEIQILKKSFKNNYSSTLVIKNRKLEFKLS